MQIRTATEADFEPLMHLINAAFEVEKFFKAGDRVDASMLRGYFQQGTFLLLETDRALTGAIFVEVKTPPDGEPKRAYFGLLSVSPHHQKSGIGRRLVAAAEEFARESGAWFMDITVVNLRTELPPIYEKLGYRITGTKPFPATQMPITQLCHFLCMTKELGHR
ncbi:GNAT family N-acetyltransferase [Silvibacterium dinghuense]|uniref:GNAT family N-acetyltransferase n=1 Tax=Silvibacterium dinghuense TaxID=1560006 RepID=A0A4Q1SH29_9BACT|nr:GNAT family N-acetyltransferase [Silvibacterium dinghuense]RXS96657.1 GNAT family N-acetyltransferase [Silvibacterium dinghuense]GGG92585.1 hypothetical protein GCM10011586_04150 [Silvibacterium dinghuense]